MKSLYNIDPSHSSANFSVKHMMIAKVHGGFEKISGKFNYDPQNLKDSQVDATIEVASINTRDAQRDTHLKSADFFEVEKFPLMTFKSSEFKQDGNNNIMVTGDLTIRDVTKKVTLVVDEQSGEHKDPWGNIRIGLSAKTKVNRKDFGLTWNAALEAGGVLVGEEITIALDVQFVKETK
jgi:polyisoprenoid-binding protein YceI